MQAAAALGIKWLFGLVEHQCAGKTMIRNILVFCLVFRLVKAYDDRRASDSGAGSEVAAAGGGGKTDLF